jgi:hypothetical protein
MSWISASNDPGFYVGPNTNMTGSIVTSTTASLFYFKSLLKTAGWQVCASWNGSSGAFYSDIISGVATLGSTNAWFILSQPNSSRSLFIQNGSSDFWRFKYSATGFVLTGSLSNTAPGPLVTASSNTFMRVIGNITTNGEVPFVGGGTNASPGIGQSPYGTHTVNSIIQMGAQNTAPYLFFLGHYGNLATDFMSGGFCLDVMESGSYSELLPDPYVIYCRFWNGSGTYKPFNINGLVQGDSSAGTAGWGMMNNLTASFTQNCYDTVGYSLQAPIPGNGATDGLGFTIPGSSNEIGNNQGYVMSGTNTNVYDGKIELFPLVCATNNGRFYNSSNRDSAYRGVSSLLRLKGPGFVRLGSTISTVSGAKNWIAFGDCAVPWFGLPISGAQTGIDYLGKEAHLTTQFTTGSQNWFAGRSEWVLDDANFMTTIVQGGSTGSILYRGTLGGQYVYNMGTPPVGASNIVIIKIG